MVDVSIIFVNYKTKELTINAINSVIEKTEGINYEIFVVDNASNDGSIEAIEERFPNIIIIKSQVNGGFGYANNLAIRQAQGKYILCLNTDTLLINNAIKIMYDYMEQDNNSNVGVCGGQLYNKEGIKAYSCGYFPTVKSVLLETKLRYIFRNEFRKTLNDLIDFNKIEYILGADIFFRKSVLDKVGLFDEKFFMYFEETDLCKRISDAEYNVKIIEEAKIMHIEGESSKNILNKVKQYKTSELLFFKKHNPKIVPLIKLIYVVTYFIDGYIFNKKKSKEIFKYIIKL